MHLVGERRQRAGQHVVVELVLLPLHDGRRGTARRATSGRRTDLERERRVRQCGSHLLSATLRLLRELSSDALSGEVQCGLVAEVIRENPANRGTETSAEVLVGPPWRMESNAGQQQWY